MMSPSSVALDLVNSSYSPEHDPHHGVPMGFRKGPKTKSQNGKSLQNEASTAKRPVYMIRRTHEGSCFRRIPA